MKYKKTMIMFMAGVAMMLAGCSASAGGSGAASAHKQVAGLDKLGTISVISREAGSGTRSAFAQMVDFEQGGDAAKSDLTKDDVQIAVNAEEVIEAVEKDKSSIIHWRILPCIS